MPIEMLAFAKVNDVYVCFRHKTIKKNLANEIAGAKKVTPTSVRLAYV